ncbi:hypothetical protein ACT4UT_28490, partial [Bacillus sp. B-TM1]
SFYFFFFPFTNLFCNSTRNILFSLQFLTFQGAHNPPNDKVTLTLEDYLDHVRIKKVEREKNVSGAIAEKICEREKEKIKAHSTDSE